MICRRVAVIILLGLFCQAMLLRAEYEADSDEAIPVDEDGKIICDENDPICEKYQALENYNEQGDASFNRQARYKCNSPMSKYYCETVQKKKCYTNGDCGDLVEDD